MAYFPLLFGVLFLFGDFLLLKLGPSECVTNNLEHKILQYQFGTRNFVSYTI